MSSVAVRLLHGPSVTARGQRCPEEILLESLTILGYANQFHFLYLDHMKNHPCLSSSDKLTVNWFKIQVLQKCLLFSCTLCLFLFGCKDSHIDPVMMCDSLNRDFGPFELSDSSRNRFPYSESIERLIFADDAGNEYAFELDFLGPSETEFLYLQDCPFDAAQEIEYLVHQEVLMATFECDSLDLALNFDFAANARLLDTTVISEADILNLRIVKAGLSFSTALSFKLLHKNGIDTWPTIDPLSTVTINQRLFTNVYTQPLGEIMFQQWIAYYNDEFGIVGLEHGTGSPTLSLKRIE